MLELVQGGTERDSPLLDRPLPMLRTRVSKPDNSCKKNYFVLKFWILRACRVGNDCRKIEWIAFSTISQKDKVEVHCSNSPIESWIIDKSRIGPLWDHKDLRMFLA